MVSRLKNTYLPHLHLQSSLISRHAEAELRSTDYIVACYIRLHLGPLRVLRSFGHHHFRRIRNYRLNLLTSDEDWVTQMQRSTLFDFLFELTRGTYVRWIGHEAGIILFDHRAIRSRNIGISQSDGRGCSRTGRTLTEAHQSRRTPCRQSTERSG